MKYNFEKDNSVISKAIIDRLPLYYRTLRNLYNEGIEIISSEDLGRINSVTPEQIRKDLSTFGEFGKKGVGYYVAQLMFHIAEILGLNSNWNTAIVGVGHLGWALANYKNHSMNNFKLKAIFDVDPEKVDKYIDDVKIYHVDKIREVVKEHDIKIGIVTVPADYAQNVTNQLIEAGVKGIWNFAPTKIVVPKDVFLTNEELSIKLGVISYHLHNKTLEKNRWFLNNKMENLNGEY